VTRDGEAPRDVYQPDDPRDGGCRWRDGPLTQAGTVAGVARDTSGGPVTIGGSIALIIIGAILRFAITWTPKYVNIQAMGVILMLGGIVVLAISLTLFFTRRRSQAGTQVTEQRRYLEPPP